AAWIPMFLAIFFLFLNTGPSNTALANVSLPAVRATAFAVNIFVIHAFGDVQAFWLLGYIGGHTNMHVAFLFVSGMIFAFCLVWEEWSCLGNRVRRAKRAGPSKKRTRRTSACGSFRDRAGFWVRSAFASRSRLSLPSSN